MQDESTLLRAVLDKPDDDAPRLAYADWCAQQDDPVRTARARFIRLQIELAAKTPGPEPRSRFELLDQLADLEKTGRTSWDGNVRALVKSVTYHRGFIELIAIDAGDFLRRGRDLVALAPIRHVDFSGAAPIIRGLLASPLLADLRSLSFDNCGLDDGIVGAIATSPHLLRLRWLSLAFNSIGEDGVESIARSQTLESLAWVNLARNPVEPNEQYSFDNGLVVDSGLPEIGRQLETRLGPLPWLRHTAHSISDQVPDRFCIRAAVPQT